MIISFPDHVSLLTWFLERRGQIADEIETRLLNVQGKAASRSRNRAEIERVFNSCFFESGGLPRAFSGLRGQLAAAHLADGFEPVMLEQRSHQLDTVDLVQRAYDYWGRDRWPGRNGRLTFARVLYGVFMLQQLEHLSLRIWDEGNADAGDCLRQIQSLLDTLNGASGSNVFIRDARWLIQTAQGALTRHLQPYFTVAERISSSLSSADRLEVHKAGAKLAGGHLRSQLRYRAAEQGLAADDPQVLAITRNSNSMDAALLVADLVSLLEAYKAALLENDVLPRRELANAVLQGVSADPELFLSRLDLLGPSTVIEDVFLERRDGSAPRFTSAGFAHLDRVARYRALIRELAHPLGEDGLKLGGPGIEYSPFGIAYGFCADIVSGMVMDSLLSHSTFGLSLEDMFAADGEPGFRAARALEWQALPTRGGEQNHFEYSLEWARQVVDRTGMALRAIATGEASRETPGLPGGRLFVVADAPGASTPSGLPDGIVSAQEHCVTSDLHRALANGATAFPRSQILLDRKEGRFLASVEVDGKWFAVSKAVLTACACQGKDALITEVPLPVIDVLRLTCPDLVVVASG